MSDDDWDASAAASRAVGDLADDDLRSGDAGAAADVASDAGDEDDGGDGGGSDPTSLTIGGLVMPLFFADERGPGVDKFRELGCSQSIGLILDGASDYVLELVGQDPGETVGPAGKVGLGLSNLTDDLTPGSGDESDEESAGGGRAAGAGGVPEA